MHDGNSIHWQQRGALNPNQRMIRKAKIEDSDAIALCLLQAMEAIVYRFIGENNPTEARAFMQHFVQAEANQYSYQNCWVAETDDSVVAAANVYNGAHLYRLRYPVLDHIYHHYQQTIQPEDETGPGEFYIDSLGVLPAWQGKGTGTRLLQFLVAEYVQKQKITLGLLVDSDNPGAQRLYLRTGFIPAGEKTLLGKKMRHLQVHP